MPSDGPNATNGTNATNAMYTTDTCGREPRKRPSVYFRSNADVSVGNHPSETCTGQFFELEYARRYAAFDLSTEAQPDVDWRTLVVDRTGAFNAETATEHIRTPAGCACLTYCGTWGDDAVADALRRAVDIRTTCADKTVSVVGGWFLSHPNPSPALGIEGMCSCAGLRLPQPGCPTAADDLDGIVTAASDLVFDYTGDGHVTRIGGFSPETASAPETAEERALRLAYRVGHCPRDIQGWSVSDASTGQWWMPTIDPSRMNIDCRAPSPPSPPPSPPPPPRPPPLPPLPPFVPPPPPRLPRPSPPPPPALLGTPKPKSWGLFGYFYEVHSRWYACYLHYADVKSGSSLMSPSLPIIDDEYNEQVAVYQSVLRSGRRWRPRRSRRRRRPRTLQTRRRRRRSSF